MPLTRRQLDEIRAAETAVATHYAEKGVALGTGATLVLGGAGKTTVWIADPAGKAREYLVDGSIESRDKVAPDPTPSPSPTPTPAPAKSSGLGLVYTWLIVLSVLIGHQSGWHLPPLPWPHPAPAPGPHPGPTPVPNAPDARDVSPLFVISVYDPTSASVESLQAAGIRADAATVPSLKALGINFHAWDTARPALDEMRLRQYLPDPVRLPVLFVYDANGQFYDLAGKRIDRVSPAQQHPTSLDDLVRTFSRIRGK